MEKKRTNDIISRKLFCVVFHSHNGIWCYRMLQKREETKNTICLRWAHKNSIPKIKIVAKRIQYLTVFVCGKKEFGWFRLESKLKLHNCYRCTVTTTRHRRHHHTIAITSRAFWGMIAHDIPFILEIQIVFSFDLKPFDIK